MKTNLISKKFQLMAIAAVAIVSMLVIAAGPAPVLAKQIGPVNVGVVSTRLTDDQLTSMLHHDQDWATSKQPGTQTLIQTGLQ